MIETKKTKQFFSINNAVASNPNGISRMEYNFNNSTLTNLQTSSGQKCVFTPVNISLDYDYKNISENYKNNKLNFVFTTAQYTNRTFTIPDNSYTPLSLCAFLNVALNATNGSGGIRDDNDTSIAWIAEFNPLYNKILIRYTVNVAIIVTINTYPLIGTTQYNATRWMGTSVTSPNTPQQVGQQIAVSGAFTPVPIPAVYPPLGCDFKTIDTIRIHSNVAKRFFEIKGGKLTQNNVLFELPTPNNVVGSMMIWEPVNSELYSQEIFSNWDNMTIELRDRTGNFIDFQSYCSFNMTFCIEREIEVPDSRDRLKNLQNLNQLSSV
jgi:hypothetical protein